MKSVGVGGVGTPPPPTVNGKNHLISENLFALQSNVIFFPTVRVAGRDKMSKKPSSAQRQEKKVPLSIICQMILMQPPQESVLAFFKTGGRRRHKQERAWRPWVQPERLYSPGKQVLYSLVKSLKEEGLLSQNILSVMGVATYSSFPRTVPLAPVSLSQLLTVSSFTQKHPER